MVYIIDIWLVGQILLSVGELDRDFNLLDDDDSELSLCCSSTMLDKEATSYDDVFYAFRLL
jgi:hypothetical protein